MRWLYTCILSTLHFSFRIYLLFLDFIEYLKYVFGSSAQPSLKTIKWHVRSLQKLPKNLGIILPAAVPKSHLAASIADLASWCIATGIPYLTVFSSQELSKLELGTITEEIVQLTEEYFVDCGWKEPPIIGIKTIHSLVKCELNTLVSRVSKHKPQIPDLQITILSEDSGKHSIAEVSKKILQKVMNEELEAREIDISVLDNALSDIPEPQLLLHFGKHLTLEGFPPWQLRLTEIYSCTHTTRVMYSDFINAMYRYANCDQRFGK
ncbi:Undecaprenyl diphosphate synthase [Basidiobolus meristosporus CBS 931.73]|uniref:ditrans,polycis-polyprenyl diphosphate synthase [(2E,6E)-farnesyldiphosphate specific] n=1 Tax=Basidiobolus meristosporus CBS 931.73 TaxID=1314790 RepID=A0A1Y1Z8Y8_9FUNG|nr:Undecaprenyl diphosphate synthase [Basidiobolus meristosporus CBS 931.73]|eukprot:ORY06477.1 Undecaprenyl diphosphate synthase [Basidiobolus meristosporus CBS 931.73]